METEPKLYDLIYAIIRQVPLGKVTTYGQVARIAGRCSAQMVGFSLAALRSQNNIKDVPWQRVINAKGCISPHGLGMGSQAQRQLLEEEGIDFDIEGKIDFARFGWNGLLSNPVKNRADII